MDFSEVIDVDADRTADVITDGDFSSLMISQSVLACMKNHGFLKPSPVQKRAIPTGLSGLDMLVQAKSGTGKTLVFSILAVENLQNQRSIQRLIVAPTREIAAQISQTVKKIAPVWARIGVFTGGMAVAQDRETMKRGVHIAVGTSGRLCQLVNDGILSLNTVDLFVLDEADQLMTDSFRNDINFLFSAIPSSKQVAVFSATYPRDLEVTLAKFMRSPCLIRLNSDDVQLIGIKQYTLMAYGNAHQTVVDILTRVQFKQALVFCNLADDCSHICDILLEAGLEAVYISSQMEQTERNAAIEKLKKNALKVLVSTDLTARGIDATNVNIVINMEPAVSCETYFHRIGRAARYGGYGAAVTILSDSRMCGRFCALVREGSVRTKVIPSIGDIPSDLSTNQVFFEKCSPFTVDDRDKKNGKEEKPVVQGKQKHIVKKSWMDSLVLESTYVPPPNNGKKWKYSREDMAMIETYSPPVDGHLALKLNDLDLSKGGNYARELKEAAVELKLLRDKTKSANNAPTGHSSAKADVKPKFVPSRLKNKKKFYMRGELLSILNSSTDEEWTAYAKEKFNLNEDPFHPTCSLPKLGPQQMKETGSVVDANGVEEELDVEDKPVVVSAYVPQEVEKQGRSSEVNVQRYSRKQMIGITKIHPLSWWREYVSSRWDTTEDPFEMDPKMRCSFEEQLRRQRIKEKNERNKILEERRRAVETERVIVCGQLSSRRPVEESSWDEYCERLNKEEMTTHSSNKIYGPVVPCRLSPTEYEQEVSMWSNWLDNFNKNFVYNCEKRMKHRVEISCDTSEIDQDDTRETVQMMNQLRLSDHERSPNSRRHPSHAWQHSREPTCSFVASSSMERLVDDMVRTDEWTDERERTDFVTQSISDGSLSDDEADDSSPCQYPPHSSIPSCHLDQNLEGIDSDSESSPEKFENENANFAHQFQSNVHFSTVYHAYMNTYAGRSPF